MEKSNKGKIVVWVIVILLLLAVAGVAVWYFAGKDNRSLANKDSAAETQQEKEETPKAEGITEEPTVGPGQKYLEIVDSYMEKGEYEQALETLEEAYRETGDPEFEVKIQELKEKQVLVRKTIRNYHDNRTWLSCEEYSYDGNGEVTEIRYYDDYGYKQDVTKLYSREESDGKVQYITIELDEEGRTTYREIADEEGKAICIEWINAESGEVSYRSEIEYDEQGNWVKRTGTFDGETEVEQKQYEYVFDDAGNLRESFERDTEGVLWQHLTYDEAGRIIRQLTYSTFGGDYYSPYLITRTYDEKGNLLTEDRKGEIWEMDMILQEDTHEEYVYDENNRVVEESFTDNVSGWDWKVIQSYTMEENMLINECITHTDGELSGHTINYYTYDEAGREIHRKNWNERKQKLYNEEFFTYDEAGRMIYRKLWDEYKQEFTEEQINEYDEKGNLVSYWERDCYGGVTDQIISYEYGFVK